MKQRIIVQATERTWLPRIPTADNDALGFMAGADEVYSDTWRALYLLVAKFSELNFRKFEELRRSMIECTGWWQQKGFGRQPMNDLKLDFRGPTVYGQGADIIAPFTISGKLRPDGSVELIKKYDKRHTVLYVGTYDGEGSMNGKWDIGGYQGEWSIRLQRTSTGLSDDSIREIG